YYILTVDLNDSTGSTKTVFTGTASELSDGKIVKEVYSDSGTTHYGVDALNYIASNISRVGYQFGGFGLTQTNPATTYPATGEGFKMPEEDTLLYVNWVANTYTIKYLSNKPDAASKEVKNEVQPTTCSFDSYAYVSSITYQLPGWTQVSWNTAANGSGTTYAMGQKVINLTQTHNGEITLYAIYTANSYTVVYNPNQPAKASSSVEGSVANTNHIYDVPSYLRQDQKFTLLGWSQVRWNTKSDGTGRDVGLTEQVFDLAEEGEINLYAIWEANKYYINYSSTGSPVKSDTYRYDTKYNLTSIESLGFTKTYHTFIGWDRNSAATTVVYEDGAEITNLTAVNEETITLYAVWEVYYANVYGVDGDFVKVSANPSNGIVTITKTGLSSLKYLGFEIGFINTVPTRTGGSRKDFSGNSLTIQLERNVDLYVIWKAVTYTITYNKNEATAVGTVPGSQQVWAYDSSVSYTYTEGSGTNTITLAGRTLTCSTLSLCGWSLKADSNTVEFNLDSKLVLTHDKLVEINEIQPITSTTINLYGMWSDSYSITYDMNTTYAITKGNAKNILGTNKVSTGDLKLNVEHTVVNKDTAGKVWEIFDNTNKKYAYFMGWSTDKNATEPTYVGGEAVKFITPTTLYAIWKEYTNPNYFTYDGAKITGLSDLGKNEIDHKNLTHIIMPRYNLSGTAITTVVGFAS
ncbi:MAG: InlB B-repeat-containing protein, partial [Clostridia bacterium]|nr:InlB B-repeat-containing protein [Clostridia bacterium]